MTSFFNSGVIDIFPLATVAQGAASRPPPGSLDRLFVPLHLEEQSPGLLDLALELGDLRGEWQQFLLRGRNPVRLLTHIDRLNRGEPPVNVVAELSRT